MNDNDIRKISRKLEDEVNSPEFTRAIEKKLEPFTRIVTLAGLLATSIFMIVTLIRGSYQGRVLLLPFMQSLPDSTLVRIVAAIFFTIAIWHLVSTIRYFIVRRATNK